MDDSQDLRNDQQLIAFLQSAELRDTINSCHQEKRGLPQSATAGPSSVLVSYIYTNLYCRRFDASTDSVRSADASRPLANRPNEERVEEWSNGWTLLGYDDNGYMRLEKNRVERIAHPALVKQEKHSDGRYLVCKARVDKDGFYHYVSDCTHDPTFVASDRVYINLKNPINDARRAIATLCDAYHVPYRLKAAAYDMGEQRRDNCVLYLDNGSPSFVCRLLVNELGGGRFQTNADIPLFTLGVETGLAYAKDPLNGESFGWNRCKLLATAILIGGAGANKSLPDPNEVLEELEHLGVDLNRPYLMPGCSPDLWAPLVA